MNENEFSELERLYKNGIANGLIENIEIEFLDNPQDILKVEPLCKGGKKAIYCKTTGIVNYKEVCKSLLNDFVQMGGKIEYNSEVTNFTPSDSDRNTNTNTIANSGDFSNGVNVEYINEMRHNMVSYDNPYHSKSLEIGISSSSKCQSRSESSKKYGRDNYQNINCQHLISCCGMFSDRISGLSNCSSTPRMLPLRGDYLLIPRQKTIAKQFAKYGDNNNNNNIKLPLNIYPVPDKRIPVLGVHFTPTMDGSILLGPSSVLAYSREGYWFNQINLHDLWEILTFNGFWKLFKKFYKFGLKEVYCDTIISAQIKNLQKYIPDLQKEDVVRGFSGIRAQAMNNDGTFVDDFVFDAPQSVNGKKRFLHVRNAPSPACTASLEIAQMIVDKAEEQFEWNNEMQLNEQDCMDQIEAGKEKDAVDEKTI